MQTCCTREVLVTTAPGHCFASMPVVCGVPKVYALVAWSLAQPLCTAVNGPREQAKDSEVFCTLAASGVEQAKKLAAGAKVLFTVNFPALCFRMHNTNMSHVCVLPMAHHLHLLTHTPSMHVRVFA